MSKSEKILALDSNTIPMRQNFYEASALPSELAGPGGREYFWGTKFLTNKEEKWTKNKFRALLCIALIGTFFGGTHLGSTRYFVRWPTALDRPPNILNLMCSIQQDLERAGWAGLARLGRCPSQCERNELGLGTCPSPANGLEAMCALLRSKIWFSTQWLVILQSMWIGHIESVIWYYLLSISVIFNGKEKE